MRKRSQRIVQIQDSQLSSPTSNEKTKPKDSPNTSPLNVESKNLNDGSTKKSSKSSVDKKEDKKIQDSKEKLEDQMQLKTFDSKKCKEKLICSDQGKTLTTCVKDFEDGSDKLTLLVHNEQDADLKVNITYGTFKDLPPFGIPGHGTKEVNITYSGDKNTKVILNAGSGSCELQISQPKNTLVNSPPKSKETENISDPKDVDNPAGSPTNPKDVIDPAKSKTENDLLKDKKVDSPAEPNDVDDAKKPKDVDSPPKSLKDDPEKSSKDVDDPEKSPKDVNDNAKSSKDVNDPSKSKDVSDPPKSSDVNDTSKLKKKNDSSNSKDDKDPLKSKDDISKPNDVKDPSKSKDENDPPPKHTPASVDSRISQNNFLDQLTFYSKQVTPIYGAYIAFLVALVVGASWALCSFRKRRTDNGVPYQELEMGLPESSNAVNLETAEGWDQDWDDDDWDEDNAIRSPGGNLHSKSISSNGLTSRATKKDDWDANWDD
uniref:dentin sialophosphoprotein-like isoform X2 n=1 Tax=Erigeron canadensis TaxID=72917 RepID=UPI001CB8CF71|nr:dentin sialophosphoprotein-like isoform X2 [Erigeron canadensis]